jgi:hypothetical protein
MAAGLTILAASLLVRKVIRIIDYDPRATTCRQLRRKTNKASTPRQVVHQKDALTLEGLDTYLRCLAHMLEAPGLGANLAERG